MLKNLIFQKFGCKWERGALHFFSSAFIR